MLPFGITLARKIFQKAVFDNISYLEGVLKKTDDIQVFGRGITMEEATADHERKLKRLLQRCQEWGIHQNPYKVNLQQTTSFMEYIITSEVLYLDSVKIKAIRKMARSTDVKGI